MDPNAALERIRDLVGAVERHGRADDGRELAEVVRGLDEWITKGGFLPAEWAPGPSRKLLTR